MLRLLPRNGARRLRTALTSALPRVPIVGALGRRFLLLERVLLLEVAGTGRVTYREWPPEKKAIDIGRFYSDSRKFQDLMGWTASVPLREGLARTVEYYRRQQPSD